MVCDTGLSAAMAYKAGDLLVALYINAIFENGVADLSRRDTQQACGLGLYPTALFQRFDELVFLRRAVLILRFMGSASGGSRDGIPG